MNTRTAELDDYIRLADLQDYVDVPDEGAYLNSYIPAEATVTRNLQAAAHGVVSCWSCVGPLSY